MKNNSKSNNRYIIWIDQKKAIIGLLDDNNKYNHVILRSGIETRIRFPGETSNKVRLTTSKRTKETSEKRKLDQQTLVYCKEVLTLLKYPGSILIIGPADVKNVLQKLIKTKQAFDDVHTKVRSADKLTLNEVKQAAFTYFKVPAAPRKFIN